MCGFLCVFRAFPVCALCSGVFSFFNPCRPLHFSVPIRSVVPLRLPYFPCVRLLSSCIRLSCLSTSSFFTAFALPYLSFLCIRLLTHALYFPCMSFVSRYLFLFVVLSVLPFSVLGLSVSPSACFQSRCPHLPGAIPPFPRRLSLLFLLRSRVFLPLFSVLFLSFFFH